MANTCHHDLLALWWAEFNLDGPEIDYFKNAIKQSGEPALDVGCGTFGVATVGNEDLKGLKRLPNLLKPRGN